MAYYPDLSPYNYWQDDPEPHTVNVGWLDMHTPFPRGDVPAEFLERLQLYKEYPVHFLCFGGHGCELCRQVIMVGEIRVFGKASRIYAAPSMIVHYIHIHHYRPPEEFIQAVLEQPLPSTAAYRMRAREQGWERFIRHWPKG